MDHFFLDGIGIFHAMDSATHYFVGVVCADLSLDSVINALKTVCLGSFWAPRSVQGDGSFGHDDFILVLGKQYIAFRPVLSRRHSDSVLESKHGVMRSIFLHFIHANPAVAAEQAARQSIRISNDLYSTHLIRF